jgi:hypothetical protein
MRQGEPTVNGTLPRDVVQRIIRQNSGRFVQCYMNALGSNPTLQGSVQVTFLISRTGGVMSAMPMGSSIPDATVPRCVASAFLGLSFPAPKDGTVTVQYGFSFTPQS